MATKKAPTKEKFFLVESECGSDAQATVWGEGVYSSIEAAKSDVKRLMDEDDYHPAKVYVVKVVATGEIIGFGWK